MEGIYASNFDIGYLWMKQGGQLKVYTVLKLKNCFDFYKERMATTNQDSPLEKDNA